VTIIALVTWLTRVVPTPGEASVQCKSCVSAIPLESLGFSGMRSLLRFVSPRCFGEPGH
jgi:hypothetical protein